MKTLLFTSAASSDLDEILNYIAKDRPHTATKVIKSIRSKCQLLVDHPEIGQAYPNFGRQSQRPDQRRVRWEERICAADAIPDVRQVAWDCRFFGFGQQGK